MKLHRLFFSLLVIFFPTQLGYHFWPEWAFVLGRRVDYLSPTVYLTDILVAFILLSWFGELVRSIRGLVLSIKVFISKILNTKYLILLTLFVGVNIFFAASRPVAIYKWIKVWEFVGLGWYIIKTKPNLSLITYYLSLGVLYSSFLAIGQFIFQHSLGGPLWFLGERTFTTDTPGIARFESCQLPVASCQLWLRPYATFPHPNVLGGYLAVTLPLLMNVSIRPIRQILPISETIIRMLKWITIGLGFIALVLTFSRSAWMAGILGISIMYFVLWRKQNFFLPLILTSFFLILLITIGFKTTDESFVVRQQLNSVAIRVWRQSPFVGVGLGNFLVELPKTLPSREIYFLQPVHNIYLLTLAEAGVVGFVLLFLLLWTSIKGLVLSIRENIRGKSSILSPKYLSLFILLLLGLVDHYPLTLQQGQLLLTLFLGLTLSKT